MMTPKTEEDVAEMVRSAQSPLAVQGGGTRGVQAGGDPISVAAVSGVTLYEPGALTLVAKAGTPVAEVEKTLAAEGQRLAFEPMDHRGLLGTKGEPTIGGVIAANVSGPRRVQGGAARDFALGVRFVDGQGRIIKNGGRVMKNVTGYDLVKLLSGSWGQLGILTEVSLKVLPIPETQCTLLAPVTDPTAAVDVMTRAMASPYDVSGAAYDPIAGHVALRIEGFADAVAARSSALAHQLRIDTELAPESEALWQGIRDVSAFHGQDGDVWRVSVKPTDGPAVIAAAEGMGAVMDWSGGLVWLRVTDGTDIRARLADIPGHATLVRASAETTARFGMFEPEPAAVAALTAGLRAKFDPRGIFTAGLTAPKAA